MSKLYIFGIGGTGSRVLKALTMLLASGAECGVDTIVPIIIDPDDSAADLTRTVEIMKKYTALRDQLAFTSNTKNRFFRTQIDESIQNFRLPLNNTRDMEFRDYIGLSTLDKSNAALIQMLFSQKNLDSRMKVGFKGNPNIGSVILNQFDESQEFKEFANGFQQDDKIFIISSIFGGTGASGFPLLLKTLRSNNKIPNFSLIQVAQIGAITVLPYFKVTQDDNSEVDSATFISKTKSALSYYERNVSGNNSIDALYYVADDVAASYENHEGGAEQRNNAHIIELISALAILDFTNLQQGTGTIHKEFGMDKDSREVTFSDLGYSSRKLLEKPLTQFLLFGKYLTIHCTRQGEYAKQPWGKSRGLDESFFNSQFAKTLEAIQIDYFTWLQEMDDNMRKFAPLQLKQSRNVFDIVRGAKAKRGSLFYSNYALFDNVLNKQEIHRNESKEQQFIELFYDATSELVKKHFNFQ